MDHRRRTRSRVLALLALAVPLALVGCAASEPVQQDETGASAPATSPESSPSASADVDTSGWLEYATHDGDLTYRYTADWTLESTTGQDAEGTSRWFDSATLTAPNGQVLLQSYDLVDLGGACGGPERFQPLEILATEPLEGAASDTTIATVALRSVDGRWTFGMGLVGGDLPTTDTCVVHFTASTSDGGFLLGTTTTITSNGDDPLWTVDTLDDATAYMQTDEYATLLEILRSVRTA